MSTTENMRKIMDLMESAIGEDEVSDMIARRGLPGESMDDPATHEQIGAFKDWFNKWNQLKSKDTVYDYAEGIFQAALNTGVSELDGRSDEDPNLKAYGELFAIFPELDRGDLEAIADKLEAVGINATEPDAAGWE